MIRKLLNKFRRNARQSTDLRDFLGEALPLLDKVANRTDEATDPHSGNHTAA